jgi:long-chain acyl-CoA synthetase
MKPGNYVCRRYEVVEELIGGRMQKVFKDRPKNVSEVLRNTTARYGDRTGFISGERRWTFREFSDKVDRVALALQKEYGIRKGDRVAVLMGTDLDFLLAFFGTTRIGGIIVPLNSRFKGEELTFEIRNSEATILILDREFWETVESYRNEWTMVRHVFVNGSDTPAEALSFDVLLQDRKGKIEEVPATEDDTVMIMYTSGTTGHPKGAMQFHRGMIEACMSIDDLYETDSGRDKALCIVPMFHSTGIIMSGLGSILMGIPCVYMRQFKTKDMLAIIEREKITVAIMVPAILWLMINHAEFENYDLSSFRITCIGGSPKSPDVFKQIREKLPRLKLTEAFGMTETHTMDIILTDEEMDEHLDAVGKPSPLTEVRIVDESGKECPPGVAGELAFRGSKIIPSYWKNPSETKRLIVDGWLYTGDIASRNEEGYVSIHDRKKDMINRGGEKIFSLEVENVLYKHPGIMEAAVIGVPDDVFGEQVKAFIVLKQGEQLTEDEVRGYCSKNLADYKVPKYVEFIGEMPRNPGGKVMKQALKTAKM